MNCTENDVEETSLNYGVNVVWIGTILGESSIEDFENFFLENYNYHIKYRDEFKIENGFYKNLNCIIFSVSLEELSKFCIFRLRTNDIKWLDDFYDNERENIPSWVVKKYKLDLNSKFYDDTDLE